MKNRVCSGCGVALQSRDPAAPGFIPAEKAGTGLLCRRCYRLVHYGSFEGTETGADLPGLVRAVAGKAGLALLVADFFDLEGSLAPDWPSLLSRRIILLVNKGDLIPPRTSREEVSGWAGALWGKRFPSHGLEAVKTVSAVERGFGPEGGINFRSIPVPPGGKVVIAGVTNTGKSSLLRRLLGAGTAKAAGRARAKAPVAPVVSAYPGTTQGVTGWVLEKYGVKLLDTPGLVPGTRMTDHLCPACAGKLLPSRRLNVKLWDLPPGGTVLFGNLAACRNLSSSSRTMVFFAGDRLTLHRTSGGKAETLLAQAPDWLRAACPECPGWSGRRLEQVVEIEPGQEFYISGLGWLGVKKEPAALHLLVPEKVETGLRPALFGGSARPY
ncbi:MAG: hypothetical protein GX085_04880 [Firmicutes bacterium]|nr:hypothetical protein [Bacillota bacterium]